MNNPTKPAHLQEQSMSVFTRLFRQQTETQQVAEVVRLPTPAFLLEVHTERFVDVMQALESAGFEVAARAGHSARYVLRDSHQPDSQPAA